MINVEQRRAIARFLWQTAAVLAGILIAFGLDAGYGTIREGQELRESLALLHDEFLDARVQMDTVLAVNERSMEAIRAFASLRPDDALELSDEEAYQMWLGLVRADSFDPGQSAINALVSSNIFERMESGELRRLVSGWTGMLADLREEEEEVSRLDGEIMGLLVAHDRWVAPRGETWTTQRQLSAWAEVAELHQLQQARMFRVGLSLREQRPLSETLDRILDLLDAALE
jgi:hypothetical protein